MRFADKSSNIRAADLKLLPSDAASFELSEAPLRAKKRAGDAETSKRGVSVAASTNEFVEGPITLITGTLGLAFAS